MHAVCVRRRPEWARMYSVGVCTTDQRREKDSARDAETRARRPRAAPRPAAARAFLDRILRFRPVGTTRRWPGGGGSASWSGRPSLLHGARHGAVSFPDAFIHTRHATLGHRHTTQTNLHPPRDLTPPGQVSVRRRAATSAATRRGALASAPLRADPAVSNQTLVARHVPCTARHGHASARRRGVPPAPPSANRTASVTAASPLRRQRSCSEARAARRSLVMVR